MMKNKLLAFMLLPLMAVAQKKNADSVSYMFIVPADTFRYKVPVVRDTVYIRDTVWMGEPVSNELRLSQYKGTFQQALNDAAQSGLVLRIDRPLAITSRVIVPSNTNVVADTSAIIYVKTPTAFDLSKAIGKQYFNGLRIVQDSGSTAFQRISSGVWFYDTLQNVQVKGGEAAYSSSRGGTDTAMAITAMRHCLFDVDYIAVGVFSQDGPYRALHLYNVHLKTKRSHNIYVHPATSLYFDSVVCIDAGKLMMHQYSGTGNGGYGTGRYSYFNRVHSNWHGFEMTSIDSARGRVLITNSSIAPYVTAGVPPADVNAYKTNFYNAGNGIFLRGVLAECTGGAWSSAGNRLTIQKCVMDEVSFRGGGTVILQDSKVGNVWGADRDQRWAIGAYNSEIDLFYDGNRGEGFITLTNSILKRYHGQRPNVVKR